MRASKLVMTAVVAVIAAGCKSGSGDDDDATSPSPTPGPAPILASITPDAAMAGATVVLAGSNFGDSSVGNDILFGSAPAAVTSWSQTSIQVTVPPESPGGATTVEVVVGGVHSNALPFRMDLPHAVYVALKQNFTNRPHIVAGFAVASNGALTQLPGSPYQAGGIASLFNSDADNVKVSIPAKRVFSSYKLGLAAWDIDPFTGALTTAPGSPLLLSTTGFMWSVAVSSNGNRVYVVDEANAGIHAVASSPEGLSVLPGSPFPASRGVLDIAKLTPDGQRLYVNSEESSPYSIVGFAVASDGALSALPGSPFALPNYGFNMEMHPSGEFLYHATYNDSAITRLDLDPATGAVSNGPQTFGTIGGALECTPNGGRLLAFRYSSADLHHYLVSATSGALTEISGSPFTLTGVTAGAAIDFDASGKLLFIPDGSAAALHVFSMTTAGAPVPIPGSPFVLSTNGLGGVSVNSTF